MRDYLYYLVADAVLLTMLYYVVSDLQWRVSYAATTHGHTAGYASTFSYSIFTKVFTMTGSGAVLTSPLTLDWLQVLGLLIAGVNGWFLFVFLSKRKRPSRAPAMPRV